MEALASWLSFRDCDEFPYASVLDEFHRVGKHFVASEVLAALDAIRSTLPEARGSAAGVQMLGRFLDCALDKWDGRYDYPTYLALNLLPLPVVDDLSQDLASTERQYDRLLAQLVLDAASFEVAAADGQTALLPQMRPDASTAWKRCRLALAAAGPATLRLGLVEEVLAAVDPIAGARRLSANVAADRSPAERRTLQLAMLPVYVVHDEYQFIRVLQSFEATFALVAVQLRTAVTALTDGRCELALHAISAAETALHEAAPLFSLLATMQVEAFRTFRAFTEGASAIQSRHYKIVESLCRQPDPSRLDSIAYRSVPEVRGRVLAGQATLDGAFEAARSGGRLSSPELDDLEQVMRRFASTLLQWRRTHYRLAVRMLGERTGTGYTEGTPYLKAVQTIPVFPSIADGAGIEAGALVGAAETEGAG